MWPTTSGPVVGQSLEHLWPTHGPLCHTYGILFMYKCIPLLFTQSQPKAPHWPSSIECCTFDRHVDHALLVCVAIIVAPLTSWYVMWPLYPCWWGMLWCYCSCMVCVCRHCCCCCCCRCWWEGRDKKGLMWLFNHFGNPWSTAKLGEVVAACTTGWWSPSWNICKNLRKWEKFSDIMRQNVKMNQINVNKILKNIIHGRK